MIVGYISVRKTDKQGLKAVEVVIRSQQGETSLLFCATGLAIKYGAW